MADGALHPAGGGAEALGYLGIEHLCDGVDDVHVLHCDENGFTQILVALDVGGYADLVNDGGDQSLQILTAGRGFQAAKTEQANAFGDAVQSTWLGQKEICAQCRRLVDHVAPGEAGHHQNGGATAACIADLVQQL